jgi:hypothetical protein
VHTSFKKTPETFRIEREDKINLYKEEKNSKNEIENVEKEHDRICREIHLRQFDCINMWLYFPTEKKMMMFREKLEADKEAKEKFENRHKNKKKEKPQFKYMMLNNDGSMGTLFNRFY